MKSLNSECTIGKVNLRIENMNLKFLVHFIDLSQNDFTPCPNAAIDGPMGSLDHKCAIGRGKSEN